MLIAATFAALLLAPSPPPVAELTGLTLPAALRLAIAGEREHSCSRSYASTHDSASLALELGSNGLATLTSDGRSSEIFGPSPSRYQDGDHQVTRTTRAHHIVWKGRVVARGDVLTITFEGALVAEAVWRGSGELPLPAATQAPAAWTLECRTAARTVFPAMNPPSAYPSADDTKAAASLAIANCTSTAIPAVLTRLVPTFARDGIPFAPGRGVVLAASARWGDDVTALRRAH